MSRVVVIAACAFVVAYIFFFGSIRTTSSETPAFYPDFSTIEKKPQSGSQYRPASLEQYFVDNAIALGYQKVGKDASDTRHMGSGCDFWRNKKSPMYDSAQMFRRELKNYQDKVASFEQIPDLRTLLTDDGSNRDEVCKQAELDPEHGILEGFFNESSQLSYSLSGYIEPLFPPMRHPDFCYDYSFHQPSILSLDYLVHDFGMMCRRLKKTSRLVLFDLGASLDFHGDPLKSPPLFLVSLYRKFGFPFDHIYAYEITKKDSQEVLDKLPEEILAAYH